MDQKRHKVRLTLDVEVWGTEDPIRAIRDIRLVMVGSAKAETKNVNIKVPRR